MLYLPSSTDSYVKNRTLPVNMKLPYINHNYQPVQNIMPVTHCGVIFMFKFIYRRHDSWTKNE